MVFLDESGHSLEPHRLQSWSPINVPDILIESEKRAHLTSVGFVTISPIRHVMKFFNSTFPGSAKIPELSCLLEELHKYFQRNVILIWDNLQGHKSLQTFYETHHPDCFHFEGLPTYSPELNVVEQCWNHIKNVELANFAPKNTKQVIEQVNLATEDINQNKNLLPAFLKHTKLKL